MDLIFYTPLFGQFSECGANCFDSLESVGLLVLLSSSGGFWFTSIYIQTSYFLWIVWLSIITFSILFDFLTLSAISHKNQSNFSPKIPKTKTFITFFLLWRLFLPDFFLASSIFAFLTKMQLSKKDLLLLIISAQLLRIMFFLMIYFWMR